MSEFLLAKKRLLYYLGIRDFSKKELRRKLLKSYSLENVDLALHWAEENKWLPKEEVIAERLSTYLHQRKKGILSINKTLNEKGLPAVLTDEELEIKKARALVQRKVTSLRTRKKPAEPKSHSDFERAELKKQKDKCSRFLLSRGFSSTIVRKVVHEQFQRGSETEYVSHNEKFDEPDEFEL